MEQVLISQHSVSERRRGGSKDSYQEFSHNSFLRIPSHGQEKKERKKETVWGPAPHMGLVPRKAFLATFSDK